MVTESAEFKKAAEDSRKLKSKPTDKQLLEVSVIRTAYVL